MLLSPPPVKVSRLLPVRFQLKELGHTHSPPQRTSYVKEYLVVLDYPQHQSKLACCPQDMRPLVGRARVWLFPRLLEVPVVLCVELCNIFVCGEVRLETRTACLALSPACLTPKIVVYILCSLTQRAYAYFIWPNRKWLPCEIPCSSSRW